MIPINLLPSRGPAHPSNRLTCTRMSTQVSPPLRTSRRATVRYFIFILVACILLATALVVRLVHMSGEGLQSSSRTIYRTEAVDSTTPSVDAASLPSHTPTDTP